MELLAWVEKTMKDNGIDVYNIYPTLITVDPGDTAEIFQANDYYFLINAFSSTGLPIDGEITSAQNAIALKPITMLTQCYKHQAFRGNINIVNNDPVQTLYVEMLVISPIVY